MRSLFVGGLLAAVTLFGVPPSSSLAQEKKAENKEKVLTVNFLGHSMFQLITSKGTKVVLDPHFIEEYRAATKDTEGEVLIISHGHNDHTQARRLKANAKLRLVGTSGRAPFQKWNLVKDKKYKDLVVNVVGTYHDEVQGKDRGLNAAVIVEVDGYRIVHLGDLGHKLDRKQIKQIGKVDVLMIPVGGIYALNGSQAVDVVKQLKPRFFILPMHYGTPVFDSVLTEEEFLEGFREKNIIRPRTNSLKLAVGNEPPDNPQVIVMPWQARNND